MNWLQLHHLTIPLGSINRIVLIIIKMIKMSTVYRLLIWSLLANVKGLRVSYLAISNQIDLLKN